MSAFSTTIQGVNGPRLTDNRSPMHPEAIGLWLAFKLASKWQSWQGIMRLPEVASVDDQATKPSLERTAARNRWSSWILSRWMLGNLANIVAAVIGLGAAFAAASALPWLCGGQ